MAFENSDVPEERKGRKHLAIILLILDITLLSVVGKIYSGILVDKVRKVTAGLMMMSKGALEQGGDM